MGSNFKKAFKTEQAALQMESFMDSIRLNSRFDLIKEKVILKENLDHLKSLDVREYTFLKKWEELTEQIETNRLNLSGSAFRSIWTPRDVDPYDETEIIKLITNLKPAILICDERYLSLWKLFRRYGHSGEYNHTPGRFIRFLLVDLNRPNDDDWGFMENDLPGQVLGIGAVSGDFPAMADRDNFIGWTKEQRHSGKLRHTAIGSTIAATQPFGFNFLGSKLVAAFITSKTLRDEWQLQTGDVMAGMTTTSLYASVKSQSIYDNCPFWQKLGSTTGRVPLMASKPVHKRWVEYIKKTRRAEYDKIREQDPEISGPVTNEKTKVITMILETAGLPLKDYQTGFERGIYFSEFYENTKDFLCGRIAARELKLKPLFAKGSDAILEWWLPLAIQRYKQLRKQKKLKTRKEFYNRLDQMNFEMAKAFFLSEIGR